MSLFVHDEMSWCVGFRVREALLCEEKKATALGGFVVEYRRKANFGQLG